MRRLLIALVVIIVVAVLGTVAWVFLREPDVQTDASLPAGGATGAVSGALPSSAPVEEAVEVTEEDMVMGEADAPVTIIEYSSMTCPHCASFHTNTLPHLKQNHIDTGTVRYVVRDFPLDQLALRAAALAHCVPEDRYFGVVDLLFSSQASWSQSQDPEAALARLGRTAGLSDSEIAACMNNDTALDRIVQEQFEGERRYEIRSTPSFLINGRRYNGALSPDDIDAIIASITQ